MDCYHDSCRRNWNHCLWGFSMLVLKSFTRFARSGLAFILSEEPQNPLHVVLLVNTKHLSSPNKAQYDIEDLVKVNHAFNDAPNILQICTFESVYSYSKCPDTKDASSSTRGVSFDISKWCAKISSCNFSINSVCRYAPNR